MHCPHHQNRHSQFDLPINLRREPPIHAPSRTAIVWESSPACEVCVPPSGAPTPRNLTRPSRLSPIYSFHRRMFSGYHVLARFHSILYCWVLCWYCLNVSVMIPILDIVEQTLDCSWSVFAFSVKIPILGSLIFITNEFSFKSVVTFWFQCTKYKHLCYSSNNPFSLLV